MRGAFSICSREIIGTEGMQPRKAIRKTEAVWLQRQFVAKRNNQCVRKKVRMLRYAWRSNVAHASMIRIGGITQTIAHQVEGHYGKNHKHAGNQQPRHQHHGRGVL